MNQLLLQAYRQLADVTPLKTDCGKRCNRSCCTSSGHMILFPGEEVLLKDKGYIIERSQLPSYGSIYTLACNGKCDRVFRPLACRIFPLAPKVTSNGIVVRMDVRGRPTCPLTHLSLQSLNHEFLNVVKECFKSLSEDEVQAAFIAALSQRVDTFASFTI